MIYKAKEAKARELEEPQTYAEALQSPEAAEWILAMGEEMASPATKLHMDPGGAAQWGQTHSSQVGLQGQEGCIGQL